MLALIIEHKQVLLFITFRGRLHYSHTHHFKAASDYDNAVDTGNFGISKM